MVTPESDCTASPPRFQQRATEAASPVLASPPATGTSSRVPTGGKRLPLDEPSSLMQKRMRTDGWNMAVKYGDLHYLAFFFSKALEARRARRRLRPVPKDDASFEEKLHAVRLLDNQRELRALQSIYLSAGLARQWTEEADRQAEQTVRQNLVLRDAALSIFGPLSQRELDNRRKQVNRWQIFERTRRLFEEKLGPQSIFAVFAFPNSTCELVPPVLLVLQGPCWHKLANITRDLEMAFIRIVKERIPTLENRFRLIPLSLLDYLLEREEKYPTILLDKTSFDYYLTSDRTEFPLMDETRFAELFKPVD
jgi:hypothetical protein